MDERRSDPFVPIDVFANPLFAASLDGFEQHNVALTHEVRLQRGLDPQGDRRSVEGGWHSGDAFRQCRHPSLGWMLHRCFTFTGRALAARYGGWKDQTLKLRSFWANVLDAGGRHSAHHHHPRHWSGVYYVSVNSNGGDPECSGHLEFVDPDDESRSYSHRPRDGEMLLFPSHLLHRVNPVRVERITVAFNFDIVPAGSARD